MSAVTFTTDQVIKGISNCSNTKAFGPDKLSIFHLRTLDPKRLNTSQQSSMTPSHHAEKTGDLEVIYCHPYPQTRQGLFSRNFMPANLTTLKVMEALILTTVNTHLLPASDQHGFRTDTQPLLIYYN